MIDFKNCKLEELTKEELIEALNSKKELDSYNILNKVYEVNKFNDKFKV